MSQKNVLDNLGRVKAYYHKNESSKALLSFINALKIVTKNPAQVPTSTRAMIRESVGYITSDQEIKKFLKKPLMYNPGKEKEMLDLCMNAYALMEGAQGLETKEQSRERKANLDKFYNFGIKLLAAKKVSEADKAFQEALKYFKNEKRLFILITTQLCEASEFVRASGYLKRAYELFPDSQEVRDLAVRIKEKV